MKKITILLIALMVISVGFLSGCTRISSGEITLTVDSVEKRHYDDFGDTASSGAIFVCVFFTIKNEVDDDLSTSSLFFTVKSPAGRSYAPKWFFRTGGSVVASVAKSASASYYIAFEVDEDEDITTGWQLNFSSFQATKSANFENIKFGFHDVFFATLTIDNYHYSDVGDYQWETPMEGNTFVYVDITLANSADNDESISTNPFNFMLYTTGGGYSYDGYDQGAPDEIIPGGQASWYMYFQIPEDVTMDKLVYDTWSLAPVEATFD